MKTYTNEELADLTDEQLEKYILEISIEQADLLELVAQWTARAEAAVKEHKMRNREKYLIKDYTGTKH